MSNNLVFYLKYRPQTLPELVGQEVVKKNLLSSFHNNKLAHAYLFVGPKGTGKTSTARILAKMVNCEKTTDYRLPTTAKAEDGRQKTEDIKIPCNKCSTCLSITDGSNMDLIEIDAASNRGVEDIRSLRDKIKLSPSSARKKVYIIDEVHMLTAEAFNALLKTLEEPPAHVLFILATTELGKIPQTILSRVQKLNFQLATTEELVEVLQKIVKVEGLEASDEALKIIASKSDGSFRDAVKLLNQIASLGEKITPTLIDQNLKYSQFDEILDLIKNLKDKNASLALLNISKQVENGVDIKELILTLMETFRSLVLIKNGLGEQLVKPNLTEDKYQNLVEVSQSFTNADLIKFLDILQKSLEKLKFASIISLPLELAVVEICTPSPAEPDRNDIKEMIDDGKLKIDVEDRGLKMEKEIHSLSSTIKDPSSIIDSPSSNFDSPDILKLKEKWTFVLETIRASNFSLEALLRVISIAECSETTVIMKVPYSFHQRILEAPKNRDLLEGVFSDILGRRITISTSLGSRPKRSEDIANIEVAQDDEIIRAAAEIFNSDTVN